MYPHVAEVQWEEGAFRIVFGEIKIAYTNKWLILLIKQKFRKIPDDHQS